MTMLWQSPLDHVPRIIPEFEAIGKQSLAAKLAV